MDVTTRPKTCNLAVIGGGPGGYTAAIRAAQKGIKTILIEKGQVGGTCLNRGCIPTKTILEDVALLTAIKKCHFLRGDMKINLKKITERRDLVIAGSIRWVTNLLQYYGVDLVRGTATFTGPRTLEVTKSNGQVEAIQAEHIIIATGSREDYGPCFEVDGKYIWNTDHALNLPSIPKTLAVIGGGNRGVEFASIYHQLGVSVILFEKEDRILPLEDRSISLRYKKILRDRGIQIIHSCFVKDVRIETDDKIVLTVEKGGTTEKIKVDRVLVTGKRLPLLDHLNLSATGLSPKEGHLSLSKNMETEIKGIYVVGDATGRPFFAHKAIAQAIIAVYHLLGVEHPMPRFVPNCIYGNPEIASVGMTQVQAEAKGRNIKVGQFLFIGNGRSGTMGNDQGVAKIISDKETGEILGVHILGPLATELITQATLAMENGVPISAIKNTIFPHPTLSETLFEAALDTDAEAIHLVSQPSENEQ
ncbi:MAG: dihydrolipoyl dehydrogenase [Candidatus Methanomethylicaceae archaeon]